MTAPPRRGFLGAGVLGNSSMFAAMLRSLSHDRPLATEVAFAGVVLLVAFLFRNIRSTVLALCSATTIIGYSSLFMASNGALRPFGKLADLGEAGCLLAAVLFVPSRTGPCAHRSRCAQRDRHPAEPSAIGRFVQDLTTMRPVSQVI